MTGESVTDSSGIPEGYKRYFKRIDMATPQYGTSVASIVIWCGISAFLYRQLSVSEDGSPGYVMLYFTFAMLPLTIFIYKIYNVYHRVHVHAVPLVPPDYGVCFRPWLSLSAEEKQAGALGAIDMKCNKMNQSNYTFASSQEIQNNTYYLIYTMLTLTLLFFPLPQNYPFNRDSKFVKALIKVNMLLCLLLLSSPVFMGRVESSNFVVGDLDTDVMIMVSDVLLILIAFICYKVLSKGGGGRI